MLVLGLTACGEAKEVEYNKEALEQSCEIVFQLISSGGISADEVEDMSDWNQGGLMAQFEEVTGVRMTADAFVTAIRGWDAAFEECGTYEGHGDYTFKSSSTGVTVITEAQFSERDAALEFTFDENLDLDAFTVGAHFNKAEIMKKAGLNTLLGMGTVFAVLIFMSFIISLFKYVPGLLEKKSSKTKSNNEAPVNETSAEVVDEEVDDTELIAVIAAAIAAAEGTSTDGFVVRSINRRKSNKWNA